MDQKERPSWADEAMKLLKGFSVEFTLRVSNFVASLYQQKNVKFYGAIVCSALAIVLAWTILKTPKERGRRPRKRRDESSTNSASQTTRGDEGSSAFSECQRNAAEQGVPTQMSLGQTVRQRLDGGRKVTCQLLGVVLEEQTAEELQDHAVVRPAVLEVLLEIAKSCDLYLMTRVIDDKSEKKVLAALDKIGLFKSGYLNKNKVLFCDTNLGTLSFVRQIEPDWHIDTDAEKISTLSRFIRYQLYISPTGPLSHASNVFTSSSIEHYFGMA